MGLVKGLKWGPTDARGQYCMLFSVGSMGKAVLSWGKRIQLLPDKGSIGIVLTYYVHISYSVLNTVRKSLLLALWLADLMSMPLNPLPYTSASLLSIQNIRGGFCKLTTGMSPVISLLPVWGNASWQNHSKEQGST